MRRPTMGPRTIVALAVFFNFALALGASLLAAGRLA